MNIAIDQTSSPFGDLEPGDVFRYDNGFFMVVDLNPEELADYIAVNLMTGAIDDDISYNTKVEYLADATLKL